MQHNKGLRPFSDPTAEPNTSGTQLMQLVSELYNTNLFFYNFLLTQSPLQPPLLPSLVLFFL